MYYRRARLYIVIYKLNELKLKLKFEVVGVSNADLFHYIRHTLSSWYHNYLYPIPRQRLPKMPLDAILWIIDKWGYMQNWRLPPNEIRLGVVFQQKWIRMRQSTVGIMRMAGRGNVIVFYLCHGTDLIFLQTPLLLIRTIWFKLSTVFTNSHCCWEDRKIHWRPSLDGYPGCSTCFQASIDQELSSTHRRICCFNAGRSGTEWMVRLAKS